MNSDISVLAEEIFDALAIQFPVCMASDEFHFFPQARPKTFDWAQWDDFSAPALDNAIIKLRGWEKKLDWFEALPLSIDEAIDARMLKQVVQTLGDQLAFARVVDTQPTFYLTIVGIGLAEAFEQGPEAVNARLQHLPAFLDQAGQNLNCIPRLFRDLGIEMLEKQHMWLDSLDLPEKACGPVRDALNRLASHLKNIAVVEDHLMPAEFYEQVAFHHMGCFLKPDHIAHALEDEIAETRSILEQAAVSMAPGRSWQEVVDQVAISVIPEGSAREIYQNIISDLAVHCAEKGLVTKELVKQCPVMVEGIPDYMRPVRSNAAFSMPPVHPPRGGTFFILEEDKGPPVPVDFSLLTAHETFPGHHLLDTNRWGHERPVRRHIEFPLFYEGWASFSEELMFDTGFFSGPIDRMLMARRRFWRAVRGKVDFDIHMRRQTPEQAIDYLALNGMDPKQAKAMVRRYSLKPGYQLSYTIGRRRFREVYDVYCKNKKDPVDFARQVLALGEIGFNHLAQVLT